MWKNRDLCLRERWSLPHFAAFAAKTRTRFHYGLRSLPIQKGLLQIDFFENIFIKISKKVL